MCPPQDRDFTHLPDADYPLPQPQYSSAPSNPAYNRVVFSDSGSSSTVSPSVSHPGSHDRPPLPSSHLTPEVVQFSHNASIYDSLGSSGVDSLFGDDDGVYYDEDDDTTTLASYVTQYRVEYGRRYHAYQDGAYWGPNDEIASSHQDLAHDMYVVTMDGRLHLAPIGKAPQSILDVGTGTGLWAINMAELYPSAEIIGTDLSAIQPTMVPPNCVFQIDDMTLPWTFRPGQFDFIHVREMFGSISDWPDFLEQSMIHMKPGGWIEIVEHSVQPECDDMPQDHFFRGWGDLVISMGQKTGKSFAIWKDAKDYLINAGFVDVVEHPFIWPINGWSKDDKLRMLGLMNQVRLLGGIEGFMLRLLTQLEGWSYERCQVYLAMMRDHVKASKIHAFLRGTVVYGRKPL